MKLPLILASLAVVTSAQIRIPGPGGLVAHVTNSSACIPAAGYSHCRVLTVDYQQVGGSTLVNFPVLVTGSLGASRIQNANCYDVVFTSDSAGSTLIPWEQEAGLCNASTGSYGAWVLLAAISASVATDFYVSYDSFSIFTAQNIGSAAPANVWDSNFVGVWHLPNGVTPSGVDSTSNGNLLTTGSAPSPPGATAGVIDGAVNGFAHNYSSYESPNLTGAPSSTNAATISMWFLTPSPASAYVSLAINNSIREGLLVSGGSGSPFTGLWNNTAAEYNAPTGLTIGTGTWHYGVMAVSPTGLYLFLDGSSYTIPETTNNNSLAVVFRLGDDPSVGGRTWPGSLDEVRISKSTRTAGWILAEYNSQKPGGTFLTLGAEN